MDRVVEAAPDERRRRFARAARARMGPLAESRRWFDEAVSLLAEVDEGDLALRASIHTAVAMRAYDVGEAELGAEHARRVVELRRRMGDRRGLAGALHGLYVQELAILAYPRAAALEPELDRVLDETGLERVRAHATFDRGRRLMEHGDPEEAVAAFTDGRRRLDRLGEAWYGRVDRLYVAAVRGNVDRFDEAVALFDEVERQLPSHGPLAALMRGCVRLEAGDLDGAERDLRSTEDIGSPGNPMHARFEGARVGLLARRGRVDEARALLDAITPAGRRDRMTDALLDQYRLDVANAAGDAVLAEACRSRARALIAAAELRPTSTLASMLRRR
jgi:hypothetical protein